MLTYAQQSVARESIVTLTVVTSIRIGACGVYMTCVRSGSTFIHVYMQIIDMTLCKQCHINNVYFFMNKDFARSKSYNSYK